MTEEETAKILTTITIAYPNFKVVDAEATIKLYFSMLKDYSYTLCDSAIRKYIVTDTTGFAPSLGKIIENINTLSKPRELNELEAWSIVSKALRNGTYGAEEEFSKFPTAIKNAVGSPSMLLTWATDEHFNESVVSSNFMRAYREEVSRQKELISLPEDIKSLYFSNSCKSSDVKVIETSKENELEYKAIPMPEYLKDKITNIGK
jgi:hypothetical protein